MSVKTLADFGININGGSGECTTICPRCSHTRKKKTQECLSVNTDRGIWFCSHCEWKGSLKNGSNGAGRKSKAARLKDIYDSAAPGWPVIDYIKERGINVEPPLTLKGVGGLDYWKQGPDGQPEKINTFPAMVARFERDVEIAGYHHTYLSQDGARKANIDPPRKAQKVVENLSGSCIKLYPAEPGKPLIICEGIETGLAIHEATGLPVWAATSKSLLKKIKLPKAGSADGPSKIYIAADLDADGGGEDAAREAAKRINYKSRPVYIVTPPGPLSEGAKGLDWLDILNQDGADAVKKYFTDAEPLPAPEKEPEGHPPAILQEGEKGDGPNLHDSEVLLKQEGAPWELNDLGNSYLFAEIFGDRVLYCHIFKAWYFWNGKKWELDAAGQIMMLAAKIGHFIGVKYGDIEKSEYKLHVKHSKGRSGLKAMVELAQHQRPVKPEEMDADPMLLNCENGVLDLKDATLLPHDRKLKLSKIIPVKFDPEAQCPRWIAFLKVIFGNDREMIDFVQRAFGYSLTGLTIEHVIFILFGLGQNGKTVFLEVLAALLGEYAKKAAMDTFLEKRNDSPRNDLADLTGSRYVFASESGRGKRFDEAMIKEITGGDAISCRRLYENLITFHPEFKVWMGLNAKPTIRGNDDGVWRRVRLIEFGVKIPEDQIDKNLAEKLKKELSGILNWALIGCLAWQKMGLNEPEKVLESTREYRREQDLLGDFLDEKSLMDEKYFITVSEFYKAYLQWSEENKADPVKQRTFGMMMTERGFPSKSERINGSKVRIYKGIGLSSDYPEEA